MPLTSKTKRRQSQSNGTINRVRSGCVTCKRRKVKCDEGRPACDRCKRGGHNCLGYVNASDLSRLTATEATGTDRCNSERLLTTEIDYASTLAHSLDSLDRMPESRQITVAEIDSIDPALLDASTDSAWHTLLNSFTLWQESETANLSEHNCSIPIIDVSFDSGINHDDEEELISSARAAYDKSIMNLNLHSRKAYDRSLKWFPPAFSKYKGQAQSSFFCQLEKEPWSRAFLHLSAASSMIRSFLVSIGTLYGPALGEEQCEVLDVNPIESKNLGKQEYGRAMKALQSLRARVARLQRQHEWSRLDFCITIQFIAAVILFMLYEELDRSMVENGIGIWSHAVTVALQMPELYCTHPFSLRCNFQDHSHENFKRLPLCGTLEKEDFDNFRILIKIIYWKDTLYRVTGSGAGTAAKSSSLIANIRAWEKSDLFAQPEDLRSNLLSSMALWTPELLDIVACATQKSTSADRGLIDQLLCRTRMARFWSDMIEDEELTNRKSIVFEALRFTVQILVMLTLDPCTKLKEIDFLRIQASLRICHVATSHEAARHEWNNLTTISTETIFDDVQYSLHLHLAFPFLLASTQIESSDLQHALLVSLQRLSSEEHHARVADRGRDSILFLRLILKEVYNISNHVRQKEGVTLKTTITAAIKGCHFAEETQLLAT